MPTGGRRMRRREAVTPGMFSGYFKFRVLRSGFRVRFGPQFTGQAIEVELNGTVETNVPRDQLAFALAEMPPLYKTRKVKKPKTRRP